MRPKRPGLHIQSAVREDGSAAEIDVYDVVGASWDGEGTSAKSVRSDLKGFSGKSVKVRINSLGGNLFDGIAVYNLLRDASAKGATVDVDVDGVAASAASVIMCAGDNIRVASNALVMIHNAWNFVAGSAAELRKQAEVLDKASLQMAATYADTAARCGKETKLESVVAAMDEETWMSADEALAFGLCTEVKGATEAAAMARTMDSLRSAPAAMLAAWASKMEAAGVSLPEAITPAASGETKVQLMGILEILGAANEEQGAAKARSAVAALTAWASVTALTGLDGDAAIGAVNAWKADAEKLPAANAERDAAMVALKARDDADAATKKASTLQAIADAGKATPAEIELLAGQSQEHLDGWLAHASVRVPEAGKAPITEPAADSSANALSAAELKMCTDECMDPADFLAARNELRAARHDDDDDDEGAVA